MIFVGLFRRLSAPAPFVAVSKDEFLHTEEGKPAVFHRQVHCVVRRRDGLVLRRVALFETAEQVADDLNKEWQRLSILAKQKA